MLLYEGWNPDATGFYTIPSSVPRALADDPLERRLAYRAIAEQRTRRTGLEASEVSDDWRAEALRFVLRNPGRALTLGLSNARPFWSRFEGWDNRSFDVSRSSSWVLELPLASFAVLGPLALVGVALSTQSWRRLMPLYLLLALHVATTVIFFALSRFRVTALPVFAAVAVVGLVDRARARELVARTWQRVLDLARAQGSALHVERAERHLQALAGG